MTDVIAHIYDVKLKGQEKTNYAISQINKLCKDAVLNIGGVFHCAIQVYGYEEWSFEVHEEGTGVFSCPSGKNPLFDYRECIVLGKTTCSKAKVDEILMDLSREFPGDSFDLLSRNCGHFCNAFCERLGVPKLPGWANRFANIGNTAVDLTRTTEVIVKDTTDGILSIGPNAYKSVMGVASNITLINPKNLAKGAPRFQGGLVKKLACMKDKSSSKNKEVERIEG